MRTHRPHTADMDFYTLYAPCGAIVMLRIA